MTNAQLRRIAQKERDRRERIKAATGVNRFDPTKLLHVGQLAAFLCTLATVVICAGRRWGKSVLACVKAVKDVFAQLKAMATENVISRWTDKDGGEHESIRQPNPAFMAMYLDRILGPVKELKIDLSDAPDEVVAYLAEKLN